MLDNVRIVLINTSHPGNIGSAARAMHTMGLSHLDLVDPIKFPHRQADELAAGGTEILAKAIVHTSLDEAIKESEIVVGTSTRARTIPWPLLSPRAFAENIAAQGKKVSILFGREQSGLTNEELHKCHYHIQIPSNPDYSSLNLAAAVQVIAYELRVASIADKTLEADWDYPWSTQAQMEAFFLHLERVLIGLDFLNPDVPRQLMTRLRRLFMRAKLDTMEMNILRGVLGAIEKQGLKTIS